MSDWAKRAQDDGHLRLKAARKLGSWPGNDDTGIPVILCGEWTDAQVKAFRILVNRSFAWAEFDDGLLSLEAPGSRRRRFRFELDGLRSPRTRSGVPAGRSVAGGQPPQPTPNIHWRRHPPGAVARLLVDRKPFLLVTRSGVWNLRAEGLRRLERLRAGGSQLHEEA